MSRSLLDETLNAWRAEPSPELAALVARAGKIAGAGREAISGVDQAERDKMWIAVEKAGDPADMDRLLAALVETRCATAIARLAKLAKRSPDPRLLEQLVRYIEADPAHSRGETSPVPFTSAPNRKFWTALLALVKQRGDATLVPRFDVVTDRVCNTGFEDWLETKLLELGPVLAARKPKRPSVAKLEREIAGLETDARPTLETADTLFAAVWAAPDDDGPRNVLADFLTERGDPRGEFIALQLARAARTLDAAGRKREKELLKRHKKMWLGPIAPLIQPHYLRFERGFLVTCSLEPNAELEATLGSHPAWSTIREFLVHAYAKKSAKALAAMLERHGATETGSAFTRGIE